MRVYPFLLLAILVISCQTSKVTKTLIESQKTNKQIVSKYGHEQALESDQSEYPLYALLEADSTSELTSNLGLEKRDSEDEKISQRIKELKTQLNESQDYIIPADTLKSEFDKNYEKANTLGLISFGLAVLSVFTLGVLMAIPAMILAKKSLKMYEKSFNKKNIIFPKIARVIGWLSIILTALALVFIIVLIASLSTV